MERRGPGRKDDCCFDMGQRVATLEANQTHLGETLEKVVTKLETIVNNLAEKRGAEKVIFAIGGAAFTLIGWGLEHLSHIKWAG